MLWALRILKPKSIHESFHTGDVECWVRAGVTGLGVKDDLLGLILLFYVSLVILCFSWEYDVFMKELLEARMLQVLTPSWLKQ